MYKEYLISLKSPKISKTRHQEKLTSIINKKTIRYHLKRIMKEYNILPEERKPMTIAKHVTKTLFWATLYLAFSYLTITYSFEVFQQYHGNQTTTNMKAIINNNVTYFPNMTICFKINAKKLFNVHSTSSFNYASAWSRFFEETISPEGIFKVNESQLYDDEIYLSLLKYLAMIYEAERAWEPGLTQISTFHSKKSDDWRALQKVLLPNIERFNITLEQLRSVLAGKLCSLPGNQWFPEQPQPLLEMAHESSYEHECIAGSKISFIGMDTICFRLIGYKNYLGSFGRTEIINLELYDDGTDCQTWNQELTVDLGSESRSIPRRATTRNETHAYYYNHFTGNVIVKMDIGIKALYRKLSYVNGDLQCSYDTSREECENKCLRGWIRANCHCSPITFNLTADISRYRNCTVDDYSICLKKYAENATYSCINKCVPLCEQWHYEWNLQPGVSVNSRIQIGLKTFDYVIIEEVFSWPSFEEFIGALGGALGIWLGLDFVIIIEFIVSLLTKLIKKILLRNARNSEEDKQEESANSKQKGKTVKNGISPSNETGSRVVIHQKKHKKNENKLVGISIRQINESEKERTSRKKRKNNALKEKHLQQKRKGSNSNRVESEILEEEMKNINAPNRRLRNQKVNITDNVDAVKDESTACANNSSAQSWFLQKMLLSILNDDASTDKRAMYLRLAEKLFWAAIYLVGSIFTTLWCVQLINLHLADEAVYYPSLINNRAVLLPPSSLCISLNNYRHYERHDNIYNELMEFFGRSDINRTSFLQVSNRTTWPKPVVTIGLLYFSILAAFETKYTDVSFTSEYERQLDYFGGYKNTLLGKELEKSVNDILLPKLLEWNITTNELRQKLGTELARMVELKISFTNSNGTIDIVSETSFHTATINNYFFCYDLSFEVSFIDPDDTLEFSMKQQDFPVEYTLGPGYIVLSDFLLDLINMKMNPFDYDMPAFGYTNFPLLHESLIRTFFSVVSLSTSRPETKGVKYCSPNTTISYCRAQCRIELIEKLCNCSPAYWAMMVQPTSGLDECTFNRYMECQNFNRNDEIDCKDSCLPSCTATYFRTVWYLDRSTSSYTAAIRFSVTDSISASIEEKPTFTLPEMLNKLGGTLGILLGFSIFSFYQVFVTAATLCSTSIVKRTRFAQSPILLKNLDKIKKSGIAQLVSYLNRQLHIMKICTVKKNIKINVIGKNVLLAIGYMIGLYATVRMSNELFYSFKTGETKYIVDLKENATFKLPSSTICMPLAAVELLNTTEISHNEDNIDLTRNLYFNPSYNKEEFFNEEWPTWLIQWAYEYLIIYDTVERHGNQKFISALFPNNDSCASNESRSTPSYYGFTSLMELDKLIDHLNITIPELKQNLGQKIRNIYNISAVFVKEMDGELNEIILNITHTTFIGKDRVCYKLPVDMVTFSSKLDNILISVYRGSLPNPQNSYEDLNSVRRFVFIDFSGRDVSKEYLKKSYEYSSSIFGSSLSLLFGEALVTKLAISEIYEAMPVSSGVRQCSESKSMETCLNECQQKKIERVCKCSPTARSSNSLNTNLTRCHLIDYKTCASLLVNNDADLCILSCVPSCTRISFKDEPRGFEEGIGDNRANISLTVKSFEYLNYKEVNKYTGIDFINEFGGILGLWIGLDILVFVDLFYWLFCKYCHMFRQFL